MVCSSCIVPYTYGAPVINYYVYAVREVFENGAIILQGNFVPLQCTLKTRMVEFYLRKYLVLELNMWYDTLEFSF